MSLVVAFLIAANQNIGLIGVDGLLPFDKYLVARKAQLGSRTPFGYFKDIPSLLWWLPWTNATLQMVSYIGIVVSLLARSFPS
jgi:hypothetical protein